MIEIEVKNHLESVMSVPVYLAMPKSTGGSYVSVERTGGTVTNHIYRSTIAIQSYADTMYDAMTLNKSVIEAMRGFAERNDISKADLNDYNYTDTTTKKYRYQAVFDVVHF